MNRLVSRLVGAFILTVMLVFITGTAYSQTDSTTSHKKMYKNQSSAYENAKYDKDVANAASILRTKVDLTMEQTTRVEGILQDFKDSASKKDMNTDNSTMSTTKDNTLDKINDVLTADQKTKFENVKTQWWTDTQKKLSVHSSTGNFNSQSKTDTSWSK